MSPPRDPKPGRRGKPGQRGKPGDRGKRGSPSQGRGQGRGHSKGHGRGRAPDATGGWVIGWHAVEALLRHDRRRVRCVHVWTRLPEASRALLEGVRVAEGPPDHLDGRDHLAQGVAAQVAAFKYTPLDRLLPPRPGGLLLALDGVTDTRNLGAILRTAGFFAADGVLLPRDRAAGVTPVSERIARGGAAVTPVAQVTNLARALRQLREAGWTIVGTGLEPGSEPLWQAGLTGPICLVLGAEDRGMRRLVREACDRVVVAPAQGPVQSLNVASFATLAVSEVRRQQASAEPSQGPR